VGRRTVRRGLATAVLLATHLDDHLLEAGHDGRGAKVPEVRHPVPCAEAGDVVRAAALVFALRYVAGGDGRVGVLRHGRHGVLQRRTRELGIDGLLELWWRRMALSPCWLFERVFCIAVVGVVVSVAGAVVLVVHTCCAYRSLASLLLATRRCETSTHSPEQRVFLRRHVRHALLMRRRFA
jgi:hypothetical protein